MPPFTFQNGILHRHLEDALGRADRALHGRQIPPKIAPTKNRVCRRKDALVMVNCPRKAS